MVCDVDFGMTIYSYHNLQEQPSKIFFFILLTPSFPNRPLISLRFIHPTRTPITQKKNGRMGQCPYWGWTRNCGSLGRNFTSYNHKFFFFFFSFFSFFLSFFLSSCCSSCSSPFCSSFLYSHLHTYPILFLPLTPTFFPPPSPPPPRWPPQIRHPPSQKHPWLPSSPLSLDRMY